MFSATNDIGYDLFLEKKNKIIIKYLTNGYEQNLLSRNNEIEELLTKKYAELLKIKKINQDSIIKKIKLSKIRYLVGLENKGEQNIDIKYDDKSIYSLEKAIISKDLNSIKDPKAIKGPLPPIPYEIVLKPFFES